MAWAEATRLSIEARCRHQLADSVAAASVASLSMAGAQKSLGITGLRSSESSPTKRGRA